MKILFLSLHPPLDPARPATGNQVRMAGLTAALEDAGHEVHCLAPLPEGCTESRPGFYASREELERILQEGGFEAILVGYWVLLAHLPDTELPVVLDFMAPRLLEAMYEEKGALLHESRLMLQLLPRADHFLVGNARQHDFLLPLLLLSGFDCRARAPISTVPISVSGEPASFNHSLDEVRLVSAGVEWPWRCGGEYIAAVEAFCRSRGGFRFDRLSGAYPGAGGESESGLLSYGEMRSLLCRAHVGLELAERNTEREFSHSFRLIEYLQCSLPVVVNTWLPVAALVREFNAGWLVASPGDLQALLERLEHDPREILEKAEGSRRLAREALNYERTAEPLLQWLARPEKPAREWFPLTVREDTGPPEVLSIPARSAKVRWKYLAAQVFKFVFCRKRPERTPDVLMVTRADLFPEDHGAAVKIVRTAEALSRQDRDVYLCTDNRREYYRFQRGEMTTLRFPFWLRLLALPRPVALARLLLRGYPWSNAFLYFPLTDASYIARTLYLAARYPIGAWQAEFPAFVRPCRFARGLFGGRVLLVEHNVEYERLKTQVKNLTPRFYHHLKQVELHMCDVADAVVTVSDKDRETLMADGVDPRKIYTIPHGVDLEAFRNTAVEDVRGRYGIAPDHLVLVYHGTYSYPPNLQAMEVMADEILPRLRRKGIAASVLAIGSKPPAYPLHPDIHFAGSIVALASVLPAADMAVVPLLDGGGTRMKILDYFAAGIPVVSTSKGIEGIPVENGREVLLADRFDEICDAITRLSRHPEEGRQLADNARRFVEDLSWDAVVRRYLPLLGGREQ